MWGYTLAGWVIVACHVGMGQKTLKSLCCLLHRHTSKLIASCAAHGIKVHFLQDTTHTLPPSDILFGEEAPCLYISSLEDRFGQIQAYVLHVSLTFVSCHLRSTEWGTPWSMVLAAAARGTVCVLCLVTPIVCTLCTYNRRVCLRVHWHSHCRLVSCVTLARPYLGTLLHACSHFTCNAIHLPFIPWCNNSIIMMSVSTNGTPCLQLSPPTLSK